MRILAIETSCDETAMAIVNAEGGLKKPRFKVLKNIVSSQIEVHRPYGGVFPTLAKREHIKNLPVILGDLKLSGGTKRVKGSYALYPTDHMAEKVLGIDMSSEPWIDVDVPDDYVLKRNLSESDKTNLMKLLSQASEIHTKN